MSGDGACAVAARESWKDQHTSTHLMFRWFGLELMLLDVGLESKCRDPKTKGKKGKQGQEKIRPMPGSPAVARTGFGSVERAKVGEKWRIPELRDRDTSRGQKFRDRSVIDGGASG